MAARKKGAQPGNQNAFKHGFYAKHYTPAELAQLNELDDDILHEIKLLRIFVLRLTAALEKPQAFGEEERAQLALINALCANIGNLTTKRAFQTGKVSAVQEAIANAIMDAAPLVFPDLTK